MKLYAFSDFHLSGDPPTKPMDIFGDNWKNHREKIIESWTSTIQPEDTVIMAGDLSWATHLPDALNDLKMLGSLPGRKIIVRGNHDYWWDTVTKMKRMTNNAFEFLHNNALQVNDIALAGTRGWIPETSRYDFVIYPFGLLLWLSFLFKETSTIYIIGNGQADNTCAYNAEGNRISHGLHHHSQQNCRQSHTDIQRPEICGCSHPRSGCRRLTHRQCLKSRTQCTKADPQYSR